MAGKFHPLRKFKGGYKVVSRKTGKPFSKKPQSKAMAQRQLRAIERGMHGGNRRGR